MPSAKKLIKEINLNRIGDHRGALGIIEGNILDFPIKRVYYLIETQKGVSRGFHAHKKLKQIAIVLSGQCRMVLDDGHVKEELIMSAPAKGVLLPPMIWHEMHDFSADCVLLVLASDHYDESDYIRNYEEFLKLAKQGQ